MKFRHFIANQNHKDSKFKKFKAGKHPRVFRDKVRYFTGMIDVVEEKEDCMICYNPIKLEVKLDGCTHSLCHTCALELVCADEDRCPMCRAPFTVNSPSFLQSFLISNNDIKLMKSVNHDWNLLDLLIYIWPVVWKLPTTNYF